MNLLFKILAVKTLSELSQDDRSNIFNYIGEYCRDLKTEDDTEAGQPRFKEIARYPYIDEKGYVLFYTCQCPYNAKYVPVLENLAKEKDIKFKAVHIKSREEARNVPTPITTYALFCDGKYVTNEQMNDKRFLKMISK